MRWLALTAALAVSVPALADDGAEHLVAPKAEPPASTLPASPFPLDIRARFTLIDQTGRTVTERDFAGRPMAIYFGYANCVATCSVAMPHLGAALDILGEDAARLATLLITVDPARDTPETMGPALAKWHPRLRGLTGSEEALAAARNAFQVETSKLFDDPDGNGIFAHGSFIYLIGADGKVLTMIPPILESARMAEIIRSYL